MSTKKLWRGWSVGVAIVAAALPAWGQVEEPQKVERVVVVTDELPAKVAVPDTTLVGDVEVAVVGVGASDHWIGVHLEPLTDTLKAQAWA